MTSEKAQTSVLGSQQWPTDRTPWGNCTGKENELAGSRALLAPVDSGTRSRKKHLLGEDKEVSVLLAVGN
jgi:hypothetical protein